MSDAAQQEESRQQDDRYPIDEYFLQVSDLSCLGFLFEAREKLAGHRRDIADVFVSNLIAAYVTASAVPVFARRTAYQGAVLTLLGVATGVDYSARPGGDPDRRERVWKSVDTDLSKSPWKEKAEEMAERMSEDYLSKFLQERPARDAADQVLRQCTVLAWSAFEVLASDLFLLLVNENPKLSGLLFRDERTKKLYQSKEFVAALEEYEYDLSRSRGDVLLRQSRMDDLNTIRSTYAVLFGDRDSLRDALGGDRLWRLYKTRNLIVHRAAVVDELFLKTTGLSTALGSRLKITPRELQESILLVGHVGKELLSAISTVVAVNPTAKVASDNA
ncbi:MAG TPA: hypothetical protein VJ999_09595 [Candidatus Sulfotelmatobacter sp.]|nr:hypothetical protein [Candidatus Sulfotelmatobacter sp.]